MAVRVDLNISLDGFATTTDQTPENPFGDDWPRLTGAYAATRTFRERVLHDTSGEGTTGVDDKYAQAYFADRHRADHQRRSLRAGVAAAGDDQRDEEREHDGFCDLVFEVRHRRRGQIPADGGKPREDWKPAGVPDPGGVRCGGQGGCWALGANREGVWVRRRGLAL